MELIGAKVFQNLKFLSSISLEQNKLSQSAPFDVTFSKLFHENVKLEVINLAANGLFTLPVDTFFLK